MKSKYAFIFLAILILSSAIIMLWRGTEPIAWQMLAIFTASSALGYMTYLRGDGLAFAMIVIVSASLVMSFISGINYRDNELMSNESLSMVPVLLSIIAVFVLLWFKRERYGMDFYGEVKSIQREKSGDTFTGIMIVNLVGVGQFRGSEKTLSSLKQGDKVKIHTSQWISSGRSGYFVTDFTRVHSGKYRHPAQRLRSVWSRLRASSDILE